MSIFFLIHSFTMINPGSEIIGVPASEIMDILSPLLIDCIIEFDIFFH